MTEPRCDRPFQHPAHDVLIHGSIVTCSGGSSAGSLPELLAERPALAGVGLTPQIAALEVMSA